MNNANAIVALKGNNKDWISEQTNTINEYVNHFGEVFNDEHNMKNARNIHPKRNLRTIGLNDYKDHLETNKSSKV